jgi:hypothetical protein
MPDWMTGQFLNPEETFLLILERAKGKLSRSWCDLDSVRKGTCVRKDKIYFTAKGLTLLDTFKQQHKKIRLTTHHLLTWVFFHSDLPEIIPLQVNNNLELAGLISRCESEDSAKFLTKIYIDSQDPKALWNSYMGTSIMPNFNSWRDLLWIEFAAFIAHEALKHGNWCPIIPEALNCFYGVDKFFTPTDNLKAKYGIV